ncbi:MAG: MBL fold metallo-hydrolase [Alphaproteobacteria bacterium]|nr:MBL fold metallo-hydrolase [Alphaproteobacteria bacterium]
MNVSAKEPLRVLAANPSPLTGPGTTTFLIGHRHVAVIDPGPDDAAHVAAILEAGAGRISHILVTHAHLDHSGAADRLSRLTGAPVLGYGTATAGRSPVMERLAAENALRGGEGLDHAFAPDLRVADGDVIETPDWTITTLHTPGHAAGHLSFAWGDTVFCGDLVMGWSSTLISPPDGDLGDYFHSLDRLAALSPRRLLPTHGPAIDSPLPRLADLAAHRRARTAQILAALRDQPDDAQGLARRLYDVPPQLLPAATRNVLAHLIALSHLGAVVFQEELGAETVFSPA